MSEPRLVVPGDDEFPATLRGLEPPVRALWVIGRDLREVGPMVAVVGARGPTPYGLDVAYGLSADLAHVGVCVVSGMARGIDAAAHEGALSAGGATVAVLGSGVDVAYPRQNTALYGRIARGGVVLSEHPPGTPAYRGNFPLRNRIIAAMSLGTVLVQASHGGSGAMITARAALELNKEVFVVPGDIRSALSWGPHVLLRDGAHVCTGVGDIQQGLGEALGWARTEEGWLDPPGLSAHEVTVLHALNNGPARAETIARGADLPPATVLQSLTSLELLGVVSRAPAGDYRRLH
jgi:DNA processing protein